MTYILLHLYLVCLSLGLIPSTCLVYQDMKPFVKKLCEWIRSTGRQLDQISDSRWRRSFAVLYGTSQIVVLAVDVVIIAISRKTDGLIEVAEVMISCTIQLICSTNLARLLWAMTFSTWTSMVPYVFVILSILCNVMIYQVKRQWDAKASYELVNAMPIYNVVLLFVLSSGTAFSAGVSFWKRYEHQKSGAYPQNQRYVRVLSVFIVTNTIATLCTLVGAGIIIHWIDKGQFETRKDHLRERILLLYLICLAAQLLCTVVFCSGLIKRRIVQPLVEIRMNLSAIWTDRESAVDLRLNQPPDSEAISLESISR